MRPEKRGPTTTWVALLLLPAVLAGLPPAHAQSHPPQGRPLAWVRFDHGPEKYHGTPYHWLGRVRLQVKIDVRPAPGHALDLLWGSKNDSRGAKLAVNGESLAVSHGGYDGFRWLRVPLPDELSGERYEMTFTGVGPHEAFLAAIRLTDATEDVEQPARMESGAHRMTFETEPVREPQGRSLAEAFPEMRELWNTSVPPAGKEPRQADTLFRQAEQNARRANEMLFRCRRFVAGWLERADPETGLIPRNLGRSTDIWNAQDSAADNYPFMVLTCALTDRRMFEGRMHEMLRTERKLTSRLGHLPDTYSFSRDGFRRPEPDLGGIIFGSSEYVKDGLLPLTEWLGPSPWSDRMVEIVDDIWARAPVETPHGRIPSTNPEVNGEMLQALSRIYWMTGDRKYLEWAERLGDYYLLGGHHPTRESTSLRLRDHGCEIVSGLSELYAAVTHAHPEKAQAYREPVHAMFDRILEVARDERGMLYNTVNPRTGEHSDGICDTWGYNYNGSYTVYLLDGTEEYRDAVRKVLRRLPELKEYHWGSADEYADSIEGAINLYNREPVPEAADWMDGEIDDMWRGQKAGGVIEGWHGDGNVARTAIMYALWKTQGLTLRPWRRDLRFGAVQRDGRIYVSLYADEPWRGLLMCDRPRHAVNLHLPLDYPRINQFPEWFTVEADRRYMLRDPVEDAERTATGAQLRDGVKMKLPAGRQVRLVITPRGAQ